MANLCVSSSCDLACSYCFAAPSRTGRTFIDLDDFDRRLDLLERWCIDEARLIGGEPTLHPKFPQLVERALARIPRLVVFTNGCMPERALRALETQKPDRCTVLVNMTSYPGDGLPPSVTTRRRATLRRLGGLALAGVTLVEPVVDYGWLPPLLEEFGCRPAMRIGLAHPRVDGDNAFLHPKRYRRAGETLVFLAARAARHGVRLELDCGFVRCMFSDDELGVLAELGADVGWRCGPVADVDVVGRIVHCFPLSDHSEARAGPDAAAADVRRRLAEQVASFRAAGVYPECSICRFRADGVCSGGCLAATMRRFHREGFRIVVPIRGSRHRELDRTA